MNKATIDVLGIGNAIFDVLGYVDEDALVRAGLAKGAMRLVTAEESQRADAMLTEAVRVAGGSAGNSVVGVASLGGKGAFIGKVADDEFGDAYAADMHRLGIVFTSSRVVDETPTATSVILVTPDGERTMNTFLGACQALTTKDIDVELIDASAITFLEGYLFDPDEAKAAFRAAAERANASGRIAALTLSDAFCIERHRDDFQEWIGSGQIGLLFANEVELKALAQTDDLVAAAAALADHVPTLALTRGAKGATIFSKGEAVDVDAKPTTVVDLTGAGDQFAGGFMLGHARGLPPGACGELGALAAAEVISHLGARPQVHLHQLAQNAGFRL